MPFKPPYPQLSDFIGTTAPRPVMVRDACDVIDEEIRKQRGVMGVTLRAVHSMTRSLAARQQEQLVDHFYAPFFDALTPIYHEALEQDRPVPSYFADNASRVADAILSVTDAYTSSDVDGPLKSAYQKLRHRVVDRVEGSMGALGGLVERALPPEWTPGRS